MEDQLYDALAGRYTKALARSMAYTKEVIGASLLNNGFTTYNSADGVTLFSTAHPTVSGLTNSNTSSTNADLNETAIENMAISMSTWVDERGLIIQAKPQKLIVPPGNMFNADRLLKSRYRVATADNDISAMVSMSLFPQGYGVNHYLTDSVSWYVTTDVPNGMKHFNRVPLRQSMDGDFETGNCRYKSRERYSFGVSDPLGIWGSQGT